MIETSSAIEGRRLMNPAAKIVGLFAGSALLTAAAPPKTETYVIDPSRSYVGFVARHLLVENVEGKFTSFSGEVQLNAKDITKSTVNVSIQTATVSTGIERRDNHLRSDAFFDVEHYPAMTFVGKRVAKKGSTLTLVGDLTIRDVTKEVAIPFTMTGPVPTTDGGKQISADGTLTINRFDYGLKYNKLEEAVAVVGTDIRIVLKVVAVFKADREGGS